MSRLPVKRESRVPRVIDSDAAEIVEAPANRTGTFSFPLPRATTIALREIGAGLERSEKLKRVTCACFDAAALRTYQETRKLLDL